MYSEIHRGQGKRTGHASVSCLTSQNLEGRGDEHDLYCDGSFKEHDVSAALAGAAQLLATVHTVNCSVESTEYI